MIKQLFNCKNTEDCIRVITILVIVLLIQMLLLRYFWNNALVPHVSVLKPIRSVSDALMLSIGINLVTILV